MVKGEVSSRSERDVKKEMERKKEAARLAAVERMNEKMKGARWRPSPKRGDVKKGIAKDVRDALDACARTLKNSCTGAPVYDDSTVSFTEDDGE